MDGYRDRGARIVLTVWVVAMVAVQIAGFALVDRVSDRIEQEALARANENCEAINELRGEIVAFLGATPPWPPFPDGMPQATRDWLTEVAEGQSGREVDAGVFVPRDCPPAPEEQP
jgi:hypothetical protein